MLAPCAWCGGDAVDPDTTCPRSVVCPNCSAGPGQPCKRPSGHTADTLHAERIELAEADPPGAQAARAWQPGGAFA